MTATTTAPVRRIIVADDDALLCRALAHLLARSGFEVVGQARDGGQLMQLVKEQAPDLVIVDNRMPPSWTNEGLEIAREIRRCFPSIGILVLSAFVEVDHALELLCSGDRVGYLLKSHITEVRQLVDALEEISRGRTVIDPSLVRELMATYHSEDPLTGLSSDEHDVLELLAQGQSDDGIAQVLAVTTEEIGRRVRDIFAKLRLPVPDSDHQRVLAVIAFLEAR
jgi:DNA-binding NarL/FixJ family response regulator